MVSNPRFWMSLGFGARAEMCGAAFEEVTSDCFPMMLSSLQNVPCHSIWLPYHVLGLPPTLRGGRLSQLCKIKTEEDPGGGGNRMAQTSRSSFEEKACTSFPNSRSLQPLLPAWNPSEGLRLWRLKLRFGPQESLGLPFSRRFSSGNTKISWLSCDQADSPGTGVPPTPQLVATHAVPCTCVRVQVQVW